MKKSYLSLYLGAGLLLIGILGFIMNPFLGLFTFSVKDHLIHLLLGGAIVIAAAWFEQHLRIVLFAAGLALLVTGVLELISGGQSTAVLHIALGAVLFTLGARTQRK